MDWKIPWYSCTIFLVPPLAPFFHEVPVIVIFPIFERWLGNLNL